jgi:hypothetical protein
MKYSLGSRSALEVAVMGTLMRPRLTVASSHRRPGQTPENNGSRADREVEMSLTLSVHLIAFENQAWVLCCETKPDVDRVLLIVARAAPTESVLRKVGQSPYFVLRNGKDITNSIVAGGCAGI